MINFILIPAVQTEASDKTWHGKSMCLQATGAYVVPHPPDIVSEHTSILTWIVMLSFSALQQWPELALVLSRIFEIVCLPVSHQVACASPMYFPPVIVVGPRENFFVFKLLGLAFKCFVETFLK